MGTASEYAQWIVANPDLKGTDKFNTVANAYKEAKAIETLQSGGEEYANESVLYEKPQASTARKLAQSAGKGVVGAVDLFAGAPENVKRLVQYATTKDMPIPNMAAPLQTKMIEKGVFTPEAEFNTPVGKVADFTTQLYTGGGLNPRTLGRTLMTKSLPDAAMDISKQFGRTTGQGIVGGSSDAALESIGVDNPAAKAVLTAGTTAVAGVPMGMRNTKADIVNRGLQGVTEEQMNMARALMNDANRMGTPITAAEAIAQVSGKKALLGTQRFVENAPESQNIMNQFMAGRPEGQRQAFQSSVEVIGAPPSYTTPSNLTKSAENVVNRAEKGVTKSVAPFYAQGVNDMQTLQAGKVLPVMPTEVVALRQNSAIDDAINHVTKNKYSGATGLPANDPRTLDAAKKYLDAQYSTFSNKMTESFDKNKAANAYSGSRELDAYLSSKSPAYAQGSTNYEVAQKTQIGPLKAGPVGVIAEGGDAAQTLMPKNPVNLYPADIKRTAELLRRKSPEALPEWTRQQLESEFNKAARKGLGGESETAGPKFNVNVAGNKQQRDNLRTLVTETGGMQAWQGFERFLDVMEAQGNRLSANSATSFNELARQELGGGLATKVATPLSPSRFVKGVEQFQMGNNAQALARMLIDPQAVDKLQELARTGPRSAKAQLIANSLLSGYIAQKPEITEEQK